MRGIILAGGKGTRLLPATKSVNKHLLPIGKSCKPMIQHCVEKMVSAGIIDIMVVTGGEHFGGIAEFLGSGVQFGCKFTYRIQDNAGGIAEALKLADGFVRPGERMCVILGDNIFEDDLGRTVSRYKKMPDGMAMVVLKDVPDPERFGVANLHPATEENKVRDLTAGHFFRDADICGVSDILLTISSIVEKPKEPYSHYAVTGIYFYGHEVFEIIDTLKPSARGELEITDVNNAYLKNGMLGYDLFQGWWTDAGTRDSYDRANRLVAGLHKGEDSTNP